MVYLTISILHWSITLWMVALSTMALGTTYGFLSVWRFTGQHFTAKEACRLSGSDNAACEATVSGFTRLLPGFATGGLPPSNTTHMSCANESDRISLAYWIVAPHRPVSLSMAFDNQTIRNYECVSESMWWLSALGLDTFFGGLRRVGANIAKETWWPIEHLICAIAHILEYPCALILRFLTIAMSIVWMCFMTMVRYCTYGFLGTVFGGEVSIAFTVIVAGALEVVLFLGPILFVLHAIGAVLGYNYHKLPHEKRDESDRNWKWNVQLARAYGRAIAQCVAWAKLIALGSLSVGLSPFVFWFQFASAPAWRIFGRAETIKGGSAPSITEEVVRLIIEAARAAEPTPAQQELRKAIKSICAERQPVQEQHIIDGISFTRAQIDTAWNKLRQQRAASALAFSSQEEWLVNFGGFTEDMFARALSQKPPEAEPRSTSASETEAESGAEEPTGPEPAAAAKTPKRQSKDKKKPPPKQAHRPSTPAPTAEATAPAPTQLHPLRGGAQTPATQIQPATSFWDELTAAYRSS